MSAQSFVRCGRWPSRGASRATWSLRIVAWRCSGGGRGAGVREWARDLRAPRAARIDSGGACGRARRHRRRDARSPTRASVRAKLTRPPAIAATRAGLCYSGLCLRRHLLPRRTRALRLFRRGRLTRSAVDAEHLQSQSGTLRPSVRAGCALSRSRFSRWRPDRRPTRCCSWHAAWASRSATAGCRGPLRSRRSCRPLRAPTTSSWTSPPAAPPCTGRWRLWTLDARVRAEWDSRGCYRWTGSRVAEAAATECSRRRYSRTTLSPRASVVTGALVAEGTHSLRRIARAPTANTLSSSALWRAARALTRLAWGKWSCGPAAAERSNGLSRVRCSWALRRARTRGTRRSATTSGRSRPLRVRCSSPVPPRCATATAAARAAAVAWSTAALAPRLRRLHRSTRTRYARGRRSRTATAAAARRSRSSCSPLRPPLRPPSGMTSRTSRAASCRQSPRRRRRRQKARARASAPRRRCARRW